MYKTISSRLTAFSNPDGGHLNRYIEKKAVITKSFCEDIILHDQVLVPTQDYLTACGLILVIGEKGFIDLLERDKLKFIRTRGGFGFVSGKGPAELGVYNFGKQHPINSPIEESAEAALTVIGDRIRDKKKLRNVIVENSFSAEWGTILKAVKRESTQDLKFTNLWKSEYESNSPDFILLRPMKKTQIRVIGPGHDPKRNIGDALLALALYNSDLYLAEEYECQSISPFYPVGDLLEIKQSRLSRNTGHSHKLWSLLEVNGVPDLSQIDLAQGSNLKDILNAATNRDAEDFRDWFHANRKLSEKEILREYLGVVQRVPWIQKLPAKALRFVITSGFGLVPLLGQAISFFDSFIVDRLFRGKSPKFFIDDLTNATGNLKLQEAVKLSRAAEGGADKD